MKKTTIQVTVEIQLNTDENADLQTIIDEMDYSFSDTTDTADIVGTEIKDWNMIYSR